MSTTSQANTFSAGSEAFSIQSLLTDDVAPVARTSQDSPKVVTRVTKLEPSKLKFLPSQPISSHFSSPMTNEDSFRGRALPEPPSRFEQQQPHINVFLEKVAENCLFSVSIRANENLADLSVRLEEVFRISRRNQNGIVTFLGSPRVVSYNISSLSPEELVRIRVPAVLSILLTSQTASDRSSPVSLWGPCQSTYGSKDIPEDPQDDVRKQVSLILADKSKGVNLHVLSELTRFSKASLSLWRRGLYKGNTRAIAAAVKRAIQQLEQSHFTLTKKGAPLKRMACESDDDLDIPSPPPRHRQNLSVL